MRFISLMALIALTISLAACSGGGGKGKGGNQDGGDVDPIIEDPIQQPPVEDPIDETLNVAIVAAPGITATVLEDGGAFGGDTVSVGDDGDNDRLRAILGFDLSVLPEDAIIEEAVLTVQQLGTFGDGYTSIVNVLVAHVIAPDLNFGFNAFAIEQNVGLLAGIQGQGGNNIADGPKALDVTAAVAETLDRNLQVASFQLRSQVESANGQADGVSFRSAFGNTAPRLEITYRLP